MTVDNGGGFYYNYLKGIISFGHKWCCNRSLDDIAFENCVFDGICAPMKLECPENEPLTLRMKDCTVIGREGYSDINLIEGTNVFSVELEWVKYANLNSPKIICTPEARVKEIKA